ncbi:hypothetical protein BDP55DRAFT_301616 [Colletotrichum godetiae]|uniref:Uncharacterized protein n=1 Tax=Colletotrichum godetiae TaxID=1209918 RepID=A0AAJ0AUJ7_9PEZI|nr:uncharacterized protein BDP55DRAFT_301616 [Colletotrichum godetiae]KAK1690633.1 hypothetical protein BDP55DRAFT_301616 [Colletotrichum godetiae]
MFPSVPRIKTRGILVDPYPLSQSSCRSLLFGVTAPFLVAFSRGEYGHLPRDRCLYEARNTGEGLQRPWENFASTGPEIAPARHSQPSGVQFCRIPTRCRVVSGLVRRDCFEQYKMASGCLTHGVLYVYLTNVSQWRVLPWRHPLHMWCSTTMSKNSITFRPEGVWRLAVVGRWEEVEGSKQPRRYILRIRIRKFCNFGEPLGFLGVGREDCWKRVM